MNVIGGKPILWDFMRDEVVNLNQMKQGHKFSKNPKSFKHAMKIYNG